MILLQATPLSQSFWLAVLEAIVLLSIAAYIGWWIARRMLAARIAGLKASIAAKRNDLNDCRKSSTTVGTVFTGKADDLKKVEGIGPKIEELLNAAGISTFAQLASTNTDRIKAILDAAGPRFQMHDAGTWPQQAILARDGKWDALKAFQDELNKGRID
jgi:predicted flap endonuclease-1-like 5' DNA nuclease